MAERFVAVVEVRMRARQIAETASSWVAAWIVALDT